MGSKRQEKDSMKPSVVKADDLSLIRGIGPARRQWLSDTFHIKTIADLATASADEIYVRLKEEQIVARSKIESWIEQAQAMVESGSHNINLKVQEQGWKPFASFVIEFQEEVTTGQRQTKAHHIEADKTMKWADIKQDALCQWMVEQLGNETKPVTMIQQENKVVEGGQLPFSEKLQSIMAKVSSLPKIQQSPVAKVPPTPVDNQDRLQAVLAKAQQLLASTPPVNPKATSSSQSGDYSDKMKRILTQAQKLTSKTD